MKNVRDISSQKNAPGKMPRKNNLKKNAEKAPAEEYTLSLFLPTVLLKVSRRAHSGRIVPHCYHESRYALLPTSFSYDFRYGYNNNSNEFTFRQLEKDLA